jgi:hypothetical protein
MGIENWALGIRNWEWVFYHYPCPMTAGAPLGEPPRCGEKSERRFPRSLSGGNLRSELRRVPPVVGSGVRPQDPYGFASPPDARGLANAALLIALDRLGEAPLYEGEDGGWSHRTASPMPHAPCPKKKLSNNYSETSLQQQICHLKPEVEQYCVVDPQLLR